ncbi:hypothetical protein N7532_004839 [Penicillium argentinense]|uniref:NACHT domain-containing protein n=1 Tax=Penicillium argentinense TaxID=1131581 RepID=A0A9W9FCT9_9EURO|nr:uncharacterized protein N7532_004839 [Penicillium argentinense]KAJ5097838.1 hypothetical protein N7532_004839 [Penicillium argentinense]
MASINFNGTNHGLQIGNNYGTAEFHQSSTTEDIDRLCLRHLSCPDSLVVKNRLKETKDKLLRQSFEWILRDPQYRRWKNGSDVCLLWIKGGAGKGKTMLSIGLIEELSRVRHESATVTYFFCQNADNELNTLESIIKGLMFKLMSQEIELKESLRRRWDSKNDSFNEDVTSWRTLWNILLEMLDRCNAPKVYVIVDALDECQGSGMADFLKLIVRNGLDHPAKIKWLLTSRPLEAAERVLLAAHDQIQVSLELNSRYVSQAVRAYISYKVDELSVRGKYGETLRREMKAELTAKAEGTFLWVSLDDPSTLALVQDATRFLLRHYHTITHWPLQIYSSAITFSPESSVVKRENLERIPVYLRKAPLMEDNWSSVIQTLAGHSEGVHTVAFSPDGKQIASGSDDNTIKIWDTATGGLQKTLEGHSKLVTTVAFSLDGKQIVSGSDDNTIKLWVTTTGELQKTLEGHLDEVRTVAFSLDGKQIMSGSDDNTIRLWDSTTGALQKTLEGHTDGVAAVIFSPNGKQIVSGSLDGTVNLWDRATGDLQKKLKIHGVTTVAVSPDGKQIASGSDDNTIKLWDTTTGDLQKTLEGHLDWIWTVAFSPDGKQIASGCDDNTIRLWDTTTGDQQKTLDGHSGPVYTVAFSPNGKQILSGSLDETIKLWDATADSPQNTLEGHSDSIWTVAFSPDGKQIASGSFDHTTKLWDTTTGALQKTLAGHLGWVASVAFSPDGKQIASGSSDHTVKLWHTTTGGLLKTLEGHTDGVATVTFSPNGKQIASGSLDHTIKLWDTTTGSLQKTLAGHLGWVASVAFSPDGKQIASGSKDHTVKLWDTTTGGLQKTLAGHSKRVTTVAFSPDGKQIASGSRDNTIKFVNPDRKPISREERVEGQNTLVNYVRSGQWSQDVFMNEPGRGPAAGPIGHYADNLTNIARHDRYWRQGYGSNYNREQQPVTPTSGGRSRRRGQNPPPNPVPFMTPTQLHVADGMSTTPDDSSEEEYISDDNGNEDGNRDGDGNGDSDSDREGTGGGDSADDSAFAPASP